MYSINFGQRISDLGQFLTQTRLYFHIYLMHVRYIVEIQFLFVNKQWRVSIGIISMNPSVCFKTSLNMKNKQSNISLAILMFCRSRMKWVLELYGEGWKQPRLVYLWVRKFFLGILVFKWDIFDGLAIERSRFCFFVSFFGWEIIMVGVDKTNWKHLWRIGDFRGIEGEYLGMRVHQPIFVNNQVWSID